MARRCGYSAARRVNGRHWRKCSTIFCLMQSERGSFRKRRRRNMASDIPALKPHDRTKLGLIGAGNFIRKAQAEGVNTLGGNVVPVELSDAIKTHRDTTGVFRSNAQVFRMASD